MTKVGFLSDIHGNLEALQAVLEVLDDEACDALVCGGDLVGYGASPAECVGLIREREIPCLLGNHDEYVTLLMDPRLDRLRDDIKRSVEWTQSVLPMDDLKWLSQLPRQLEAEDFSMVHGAFGPKPWVYCTNEKSLTHNFEYQDVPLGFCGHSHMPLIALYREGEPPVIDFVRQTPIPDSPKVMINVGSVGQPRDRDPRAACLVLELETRVVRLLRVPYDIAAAQQKIREAGLPERFAERLEIGR